MSQDWIEILREECEPPNSQRQVAKELGVSCAQISLVLRNAYTGDLTRIQQLVEGKYMNVTLECPVLGKIALHKCRWHQEREFAATNPQRVMLYQMCRSGCPHSNLEQIHPNHRQLSEKKNTVPPPNDSTESETDREEKVIYCQVTSEINKPLQRTAKGKESYKVQQHIAHLHRAAKGDQARLISLLERELKALAQKYNQLRNKR